MVDLFRLSMVSMVLLMMESQALADTYFNSSSESCTSSSTHPSGWVLCDDFERGAWYTDVGGPDAFGWYGQSPVNESPSAIGPGLGYGGTNYAANAGTYRSSELNATANTGATTVSLVSTANMPSSATNAADDTVIGWSNGENGNTFGWTGKTGTSITGVSGVDADYPDSRTQNLSGVCDDPAFKCPVSAGLKGNVNTATHAFSGGGYDELYARFYVKFSPTAGNKPGKQFVFGACKFVSFNDQSPAAGLGMALSAFNPGGALGDNPRGPSVAINDGDNNIYDENVGSIEVTTGNWYFFEQHAKLNTVGSNNGIRDVWMKDCGTDLSGCDPNLTTPTHLIHVTTAHDRTSAGTHILEIWFDNWCNPISVGKIAIDQLVVSTTGPIGFMPLSNPSPPSGGTLAMFLRAIGPISTLVQLLFIGGYFWERRSAAVRASMTIWRYCLSMPTPKEMYWMVKYRTAIKRWQKQAPVMLPPPMTVLDVPYRVEKESTKEC